ncbi:MAG: DNA mismatch endonuclease Vsr [Ignavibacteria bacterium]|nr:DNA mismatch endonuclease Vsr [Ignavibacteria bacterium]MCU7521208.1 DNA mismatch endonuclease Vsr [Ignavibacteria bacterium]
MADHLSKEKRSWNMSRIRSKNSKPELIVRSFLHKQGFRFRLYSAVLPGKPDLVLSKYKTVIFIQGCFWHRHPNCSRATMPKSNIIYWRKKFESNQQRDKSVKRSLEKLGWKVITVWECELTRPQKKDHTLESIVKKITKSD